jgi:hypothetical protein
VDLSACSTYQLALDASNLLQGALETGVENQRDLKLVTATVTFSPGWITFFLQVRQALENAPDATVRINGIRTCRRGRRPGLDR